MDKTTAKKGVNKTQLFSKPRSTEGDIEITYLIVDEHHEPQKYFHPGPENLFGCGKKHGLFGVAFLTPVILSIPIGTLILNAFEDNKKKIFIYMFFSILFWAVLLTTIFELLHVVNIPELKERIFG